MNTIVKTALNLRGLSVPEKMGFGNNIQTGMNNNPNFPNTFSFTNILQQALNDLNVALANAHPGDAASTSAMHDKEYELERTLRFLAAYVEYQSHDDPTKALSSGFSLKKAKGSVASVFSATCGVSHGSADLSLIAVKGAAYLCQYCLDPITESGWTGNKITNHASCSYTGLTPVTKYWFRVAVIINDQQQPFCDPVMLVVL